MNLTPEVEIEKEFSSHHTVATWQGNKRAAYSITFDDENASHYLYAEPELTKRKLKGTFFINTKAVHNWQPWRRMSRRGHEIASHTRKHPRLTEISLQDVQRELSFAKIDIMRNIGLDQDVASFSYPCHLHNQDVRDLVKHYHLAARGSWGLNSPAPDEEERYHLKAVGLSSKYTLANMSKDFETIFHTHGWMIVYQHGLNIHDQFEGLEIPMSLFRQHLDDVVARQDSLWVDTMGNVAKYCWLREHLEIEIKNSDKEIVITAGSGLAGFSNNVPLTLVLDTPKAWTNHHIYSVSGQKAKALVTHNKKLVIDIMPQSQIKLFAKRHRIST